MEILQGITISRRLVGLNVEWHVMPGEQSILIDYHRIASGYDNVAEGHVMNYPSIFRCDRTKEVKVY